MSAVSVSPTCGVPLIVGVPVAAVSVFQIVPNASRPKLAKPAPEALLSTSVNVSPLSSTVSSAIGTDTVFSSSPGAKVSVPLIIV